MQFAVELLLMKRFLVIKLHMRTESLKLYARPSDLRVRTGMDIECRKRETVNVTVKIKG